MPNSSAVTATGTATSTASRLDGVLGEPPPPPKEVPLLLPDAEDEARLLLPSGSLPLLLPPAKRVAEGGGDAATVSTEPVPPSSGLNTTLVPAMPQPL